MGFSRVIFFTFYLGWRSVYCSICGGKSGTCVLVLRLLVGSLRTFICKKIADRLMKFEEQLPEALDIIKRVLQAGQPITQAFGESG